MDGWMDVCCTLTTNRQFDSNTTSYLIPHDISSVVFHTKSRTPVLSGGQERKTDDQVPDWAHGSFSAMVRWPSKHLDSSWLTLLMIGPTRLQVHPMSCSWHTVDQVVGSICFLLQWVSEISWTVWSVLNEVLEYVASLNRRRDPGMSRSQEASDLEMLRAPSVFI